ncbi:putative carboxylesterase [Lupinus albus]|uniref:Putative carboxylesterase n=1 Tax=Lupinus albus TaxID=3870 RepID=A0A6A4PF60_LUPAL|nr:putative carboxylesterase [Lupinus albus]
MPDNDDPRVNPVAEGAPSLAWLGCRRVLVCVAEKDVLRDRGWLYYNALGRSGCGAN